MTMEKMARVTAVGLIAAGLLWFAGARAAASAAPALLTGVPPVEQEKGKPLVLAARLTDATTGKAIGNADVQFYVMTDVFGPRLMSVGHGLTDTTGRAAVSYRPSWQGQTQVIARFAGNAQYGATESTYEFVATNPVPGHQDSAFGLEPVRAWAPVVVILLVLAVWAVLIAVAVSTAVGLRARPSTVPAAAPQPVLPHMQAGQEFIDGAS